MNIIWDITNKCNLSCKHCSNIELINSKNNINNTSWTKSLDYVSDFVDSVTLLGGEPLLHPEINTILKHLTKRDISINIITNGQFDSSVWEEVMNNNISSIQISIEGMKDSNDNIRGYGSWDKAIDSLICLCNIKKITNSKTDIGVSIVINKITKNSIIDFIDSTKHLDIFYNLNTLYIDGNAKNNEDLLSLTDCELIDCFEKIALYNSNNSDLKIKFNVLPIISDYLNRKYGTNYMIRDINCKGLTDQVYIDPYGNFQPCRKYSKVKIDTNNSENKWENDYILFKEYLEKVHSAENTYCDECIYKSRCVVCPFENQKTMPSICKKIMENLNDLSIPLETQFKIRKPYMVINSEEYSQVFFPNSHLIVEYETIGGKILEYIDEFKTLKEISDHFSIDPKIIYEFLLQEKYTDKVIEKRVCF